MRRVGAGHGLALGLGSIKENLTAIEPYWRLVSSKHLKEHQGSAANTIRVDSSKPLWPEKGSRLSWTWATPSR